MPAFSQVGLIPARAGNTARPALLRARSRAHPRSRGEHEATVLPEPKEPGSSPLARGTPSGWSGSTRARGLIPARAGNTWSQSSGVSSFGAHPRSRGEHVGFQVAHWPSSGSSPLARGTPSVLTSYSSSGWLIPARAGNTAQNGLLPLTYWAHPRSRGEHVWRSGRRKERRGSSPLARGTQRGHGGAERGRGLIPARAGNTIRGEVSRGGERAHPRSRGEHVIFGLGLRF